MLEEKVMNNLFTYIKFIKDRVDKLNYAVDNPIYAQSSHNPFSNTFNKTYVWVDESDEEEESG